MLNIPKNKVNLNRFRNDPELQKDIQRAIVLTDLCTILEELESLPREARVTAQAYSAVQSAAASLFSELFKALPPRVAREAQSAIQNALFSLDLEDPKKGGA